jgi:hypothetical protein
MVIFLGEGQLSRQRRFSNSRHLIDEERTGEALG